LTNWTRYNILQFEYIHSFFSPLLSGRSPCGLASWIASVNKGDSMSAFLVIEHYSASDSVVNLSQLPVEGLLGCMGFVWVNPHIVRVFGEADSENRQRVSIEIWRFNRRATTTGAFAAMRAAHRRPVTLWEFLRTSHRRPSTRRPVPLVCLGSVGRVARNDEVVPVITRRAAGLELDFEWFEQSWSRDWYFACACL